MSVAIGMAIGMAISVAIRMAAAVNSHLECAGEFLHDVVSEQLLEFDQLQLLQDLRDSAEALVRKLSAHLWIAPTSRLSLMALVDGLIG